VPDNIKAKRKSVQNQISKLTPAPYLKANISIALVASAFERLANKILAKDELNHSGFMILYLIVENGGSMNITEITKKLYLTRQAVSSSTRYLEKKGLISRNGNKGDRRKIRVEITEKGLESVEKIGTSSDRRQIHNVLAPILSADEASKLAVTLNLIARKLHRMKYI
jgi:DNA-binding MarR family transcriptional regulator